eukprot:TRINITY_DN14304_c0_g1_i1.p1 TRINITY_DN14304_c0_g1~~TRINITY_DN14304_c0_g1_i1.p1  ORF type:complete len:305 (-),score=69.48 TRINITY_DN14304_c0_g1_i1:185-1099(-)
MSDTTADSKPKAIPMWKSFIAGSAGGMSLVLAGHPLDTIKVRLQTMTVVPGQAPPYKGGLDCAMQTIRREGPLGLYKGVTAPLGGVGFMYAICFYGYAVGKNLVRNEGQSDNDLSLVQYWNAGMISGIFTTAVMVPLEQVKVRLQVDGEGGRDKKYTGIADCFVKTYKEGGIRSLYRGTLLTLMRDLPGSGAYFAGYEGTKRFLAKDGDTSKLTVGQTLVSGGMAGVFNWLIALPPDTLKSRFQTAAPGTYSGVLDCYRNLIRTDGYLGLFRGFGPIMARAFPANAACFVGYEVAMSLLNKLSP